MNLTSFLFRAARLSATARAISSGNPKRMVRRTKDVVIGRMLRKAGLWSWLWK